MIFTQKDAHTYKVKSVTVIVKVSLDPWLSIPALDASHIGKES